VSTEGSSYKGETKGACCGWRSWDVGFSDQAVCQGQRRLIRPTVEPIPLRERFFNYQHRCQSVAWPISSKTLALNIQTCSLIAIPDCCPLTKGRYHNHDANARDNDRRWTDFPGNGDSSCHVWDDSSPRTWYVIVSSFHDIVRPSWEISPNPRRNRAPVDQRYG